MHELALTQALVEMTLEELGSHPHFKNVSRIVLEIGKVSGVMPDAIRFCFDVCTAGTAAEGASLEIKEIDGLMRCRECSQVTLMNSAYGQCPCGCHSVEWIAGTEMKMKEMEMI